MRKFKIFVLSILSIFILSSCSGDVPSEIWDGIESSFTTRVADNIKIVEKLYSAGLVSEQVKTQIINGINSNVEHLLTGIRSQNTDTIIELGRSITDWMCVREPDPIPYDTEEDVDYSDTFLTNYIHHTGVMGHVNTTILEGGGQEGSDISPITLVSESNVEELQKSLMFHIYVLSPSVTDLAEVIHVIENNDIMSENSAGAREVLEKYFIPVKDENGNNVTLLDSTDPNYKIVGNSKGNGKYIQSEGLKTIRIIPGGHNGAPNNDNGCTHECHSQTTTSGYLGNRPGVDVLVSQHSKPTFRFRVVDFDQEVIERIISELALTDGTYLMDNANNRAYLMQYPVGYISGFSVNDVGDHFKANIAKSDIVVNLKTKAIGKVYTDPTTGLEQVKITSSVDEYVSMTLDTKDSSSFVIYGETGLTTGSNAVEDGWDLEFGCGGSAAKASVARIVLRDYLESSYSPGIVAGTNLACFGRKLRIEKFEGSVSTESNVAYYLNFNETKPDVDSDIRWINLFDFGDVKAIHYTNTKEVDGEPRPYIKYLPRLNTEKFSSDSEISDFETGLSEENNYDFGDVSNLQSIAAQSIDCTLRFPGGPLNTVDLEVDPGSIPSGSSYADYVKDTPVFYAMFIKKGLGESGLVSYITSPDEVNSSTWWNSWLESHGFNYRIKSESTLSFLQDNYSYEVNSAGILRLNLETISKIQRDFDMEDNLNRSRTIRTVFKILGYAIVCYGVLLLLAWNVDVNVDFGFNLLETFTFGRFVAVVSDDEIPKEEDAKVAYVGFMRILLVSLVMMTVGIALVFVDFVSLIVILINQVGRISTHLTSIIRGV